MITGSNINIVGTSTTDTSTNKTITDYNFNNGFANLTFSGGGEVLGIPTEPTQQGS